MKEAPNRKMYQRKYRRWPIGVLTAAGVALLVLITASAVQLTGHEYVMTDGVRQQTVRLHPGTVEQACEKAGFDGLTVVSQRDVGGKTYLQLSDKQYALIRRDGIMISVPFTPCTVQELLYTNGITLKDNEIVSPALYTTLTESTDVTIISVDYQTVSETEEIDFPIETQETDQLPKGKKRVARTGVKGKKEVTYSILLHNGEEIERDVVAERVVERPVSCIVEQGTGKTEATEKQDTSEQTQQPSHSQQDNAALTSGDRQLDLSMRTGRTVRTAGGSVGTGSAGGTSSAALSTAGKEKVWSSPTLVVDDLDSKTITTPDGQTYSYSDMLSVKATAYHRMEEGGLITASGTTTKYGTVAVDPRVIPLGSRVYVVSDETGQSWSYGPGLAEDTGGLIKGNRIDLFFMTGAEADDFGVRAARIYILK